MRIRFGQRARELRLATGMSQETFADHCGFARSYVSRIERGNANPSLDAIEVLAIALDVDVRQLFDEPSSTANATISKSEPLKVPFARDGSYFHPDLRKSKAKHYVVGEKGDLKYFDTFEAALEYLKSMHKAHWLRPNQNGNWGVVAAVRWDLLPTGR